MIVVRKRGGRKAGWKINVKIKKERDQEEIHASRE